VRKRFDTRNTTNHPRHSSSTASIADSDDAAGCGRSNVRIDNKFRFVRFSIDVAFAALVDADVFDAATVEVIG
jgi:hypothetical protein